MKVLLIGASGSLGGTIYKTLLKNEGCEVLGTFNQSYKPGLVALDTTNKSQVYGLFNEFKPDVVIQSSAITGNVMCLQDKGKAYSVNVEGTRNIAVMSSKFGSKMINISTASVFDGLKDGPYTEEDIPENALDYYGETKSKSEKMSLLFGHSCVNLRMMKILGDGFGFIKKAIEGNCNLFNDTPLQFTGSLDASDNIAVIVKNPDTYHGTYHIASEERVTQYDLAMKIRRRLGISEDKNPIKPISDREKTGPNIILSIKRAKECGMKISSIDSVSESVSIERHLNKER